MLVTSTNGQRYLLNPSRIESVREACASAQWHGTRSHLTTVGGDVLDLRDEFADLQKRIADSFVKWLEQCPTCGQQRSDAP